ncbi:histone deacetylase family protein [Polymorphobacter fuscus]|uniref:Histone deacetylase n=1 Tax=Sandarakinorhabdus fusca TaxID=1439888 RepID=A0A7C9GVV9_9SPHN|nr:histone deacetylase [Polymorphobacter fuscus]KAB7646361.1 histone deacetylase [Polymorphobacter fuscus]MQT17589.1 histone deacetylase [Polymorphobacter fuscus]NJC09868.1 acetoin utilization deacetylase AcuC-like enzyme [Polymorphobacter fuscus]
MTAPLPLFHHPDYVAALPAGHSFPMSKYALLLDALAEAGQALAIRAAAPMPAAWVEAVHDPAYVAAVLAAAVPPERERRIGFPVTADVARRTLAVAGGTHAAALWALRSGYAANGAGGSHHALPDGGAGYCVTNDLAIAASRLVAEGDATRILIVDLDVHQGDGTAVIFAGRDDVLTFSMHAEKNFPVRKARGFRDVELPDAMGDDAYLALLAAELPPLLALRPDLVLFQAGVDPHAADRLGRLALTDAGLAARDAMVVGACRSRGIPVASTLGGGYDADRMVVARRHAAGLVAQWAAAAPFQT